MKKQMNRTRVKCGHERLEDKFTTGLANDIDIVQYPQVYTKFVDHFKCILLVNFVYCLTRRILIKTFYFF